MTAPDGEILVPKKYVLRVKNVSIQNETGKQPFQLTNYPHLPDIKIMDYDQCLF